MLSYIIRRTLYMIPTVVGVIVITFVLFNIAGGDPAVMKLGKQATAAALQQYDLQRGLNKPLFFGKWGSTRAYQEPDFNYNPGPWSNVEGVQYESLAGCIVMGQGEYKAPMSLPLDTGVTYRWSLRYRLKGDKGEPEPVATLAVEGEDEPSSALKLRPSARWHNADLVFEVNNTGAVTTIFDVERGRLEVESLSLGRRVRHPLDSQFLFYIGQIARLDLGVSAETNQRVVSMIKDGIGPSLALTAPIFVVGVIMSISLALVCAFFRDRPLDRFLVIAAVALMSVNYLVWIVGGQYALSYKLGWFPIWGFESWRYLVLPWIIGVISGLGWNLRFYRTIMLEEMHRDYVRTAFAKGVGRRGVLFRHVLKNAMIPILTSVVMAIPFLYTGSLLLESFFGIPGLGSISVNALNSSDFDVIRAVVLVGAVIYVIANLITDISYAAFDPRVRLK